MLKKCTRLWRTAHLEVQIFKTCGVCSTFGRADVENLNAAEAKRTLGSENVFVHVEKMHAAVAKGTFGSQNLQFVRH